MDGNEIVSKAMDDFSQWEKSVSETISEELVGEWDAMSVGMRTYLYGETDSDLLEEVKKLKTEVRFLLIESIQKSRDNNGYNQGWHDGKGDAYGYIHEKLVALISQSQ